MPERNDAYCEWASEHLLDRDDETAWRAARNHNGTTRDEMIARNAADRAEVEGEWAAKVDAERDAWRLSFGRGDDATSWLRRKSDDVGAVAIDLRRPRWDGTYEYRHEGNRGYPVPAMDDRWPDLDKLRWWAAGAAHGTHVKLQIDYSKEYLNGQPVAGRYMIATSKSCTGSYDFMETWVYINGFRAGLEAAT